VSNDSAQTNKRKVMSMCLHTHMRMPMLTHIVRWRGASELSLFPSNKPVIKVKVKSDTVESASTAVDTCRYHCPIFHT